MTCFCITKDFVYPTSLHVEWFSKYFQICRTLGLPPLVCLVTFLTNGLCWNSNPDPMVKYLTTRPHRIYWYAYLLNVFFNQFYTFLSLYSWRHCYIFWDLCVFLFLVPFQFLLATHFLSLDFFLITNNALWFVLFLSKSIILTFRIGRFLDLLQRRKR